MDILFGIIIFAAVSIFADKIEGKKKKNKDSETVPSKVKSKKKSRVEQLKDFLVEAQDKDIEAEPKPVVAKISSVPAKVESVMAEEVPAPTPRKIKQEDVNADILLHAVAYSQILQPPKAYQYIATRSCRGDWMNNK